MERKEALDLIKAWSAISIAFGIVLWEYQGWDALKTSLMIAAFTVGIGFLFHELAHRMVAKRYGLHAEFESFDMMLVFAIALSFLGFVFAAPGAVMLHGRADKKVIGKVSVAGPLSNIILAFLFFLIPKTTPFLTSVSHYGVYINSFLAVFNLIPFWNFDGLKIWHWNKLWYFSLMIGGFIFLFLSFSLVV